MKVVSVFSQIRALTGLSVHPDTWLESHAKRLKLEKQTRQFASELATEGFNPFREVNGNEFSVVGMVTGEVQKLAPYRNLNILPSQASANRCQVLKQMDFFCENSPHHLRFAVVTNGPRCPLSELRERMQALSRMVSNFAAAPELKALGLSVEARANEVTVKRESDGKVSCHPHANIVISLSRKLPPEDFRKYLMFGHAFFGKHWKDCGRLRAADEVFKYPTKPCEVEILTPREKVELAVALQSLKMVQPMASFAEFRRGLDDEGVKLGKTKASEQGDWEWCKVARPSYGRADDEHGDDLRETIEKINREEKAAPVNHVVSLMAPAPRFGPRFEPSMLVLNYTGNLDAALATAQLQGIAAEARAAWAARGVAPPLKFTPSRQLLSETADETNPDPGWEICHEDNSRHDLGRRGGDDPTRPFAAFDPVAVES